MKAAVLYEPGQPLRIEEVELSPPRAGEVLVRVGAAGVCHSDYHVMHGDMAVQLPAVLGHEGAGIVEAVGPGITSVAPSGSFLDRLVKGPRSRAPRVKMKFAAVVVPVWPAQSPEYRHP